MAYTGFYGCCSGYYSWWWQNYNATHNSDLWLRGDSGEVCNSDTGTDRGPIYDLCSQKMLDYYKHTILASYVQPKAKSLLR